MTGIGRRLGRYRLEEPVGQGGMAEVWRARDEKLDRTVAVKVIRAVHARDSQSRERFEREARLVASLDHPNVLPVYDYGDEAGVPYLVMPFLEGGTLRDRMSGAPVPFALAISWVRQLGDALDAAHAAGILHRDVKPANVLVRKDDRLALADFGIAKMLEGTTGLTVTGMVVGTPIYMAPEQAQGRPATSASDRYALAVLAYELLSGRPPFEGESALALMHQHATAPAPPLSASVEGLPAGLDPVFREALAKEPERRPPTCRAFADQLSGFVPAGTAVDATVPTGAWPSAGRLAPTGSGAAPRRLPSRGGAELTSQPTISTAPRPSRRTLLAAGVGGGAFLLLVGAWLLGPGVRPVESEAAAPRGGPPPAGATTTPAPGPAGTPSPSGGASRAARTKAAEAPASNPVPPVPVPPAPPAAIASQATGPGPGGVAPAVDLAATRARLDPARNGHRRPTRNDYEAAARSARSALASDPGTPGAPALEIYALGGLAYLEGRDAEALRRLVAAEAAGGGAAGREPWAARAALGRLVGGKGGAGWELALAYGDARGEAEQAIESDLAAKPGDSRALLGRAALRQLEGRSDEAVADAAAVFESRPPAYLGSAAAALVASEHAAAARWEEAARWYREAAIPPGPATARAGLEGGRILEEELGRHEEARELYAVACRAGSREACRRGGPAAARPRLLRRRRAP